MEPPVERTPTKRPLRALLRRGGIAVGGSLLVNWGIVAAVRATALVGPLEYFQFGPVTLWTTVGVIGAVVVYRIVDALSGRPDRTFTVVAGAVLVLSFGPNVGLFLFDPAATAGGVVGLMSMHVTTAIICVAALTADTRERT
ncbi:hypothetical protein D8Y22_01800 [Salinadaptatus halalkaliphilus]|uniref:Uncharacterized protein n=1 Tax=Salinadaptatus halalkaliphilus TaxID=2419781 RepID=A0A4S3TQJ5_9EURY|nr:hypothetical protein [Salinadaptatus halalkaliphilus]THE66556.1 hypothetical protein D8Y22_01800 [Salinadaptatus halalkaliphilus]